MSLKRDVPLTKAGKPDKRYAKSVKAKTKTGATPNKRTQKRRTKRQIKGYSANPKAPAKYVVKVVTRVGSVGYYRADGHFDTDIKNAFETDRDSAEMIVARIARELPKYIARADIVKK